MKGLSERCSSDLVILVVVGLLAVAGCAQEEPPEPQADGSESPPATVAPGASTVSEAAASPGAEIEERARAALGPLKKRLMGELTAALADGPVRAIGACRLRAQEIPAELAKEGLEVGRTSHRLRNRLNAPEPWMEPLLAAYVADPADRAPRTVAIDGTTVGYVEPIVLQPMCLACHGTSIDPSVAGKLAELYPDDEATGFEAGDLRGMFWVKLPVAPPVD